MASTCYYRSSLARKIAFKYRLPSDWIMAISGLCESCQCHPQEREVTWKDFAGRFPSNRILAMEASTDHRIKDRIASGKTTQAKVNRLNKTLATSYADLVEYQKLQSRAFASGLLTQEEAATIYQWVGGENPTEEKWSRLSVAQKATITELMQELMGRSH